MSKFQQSQTLLTEIGLSTPLDIIGPVLIGGLLAAFFFAFENPAIVMNADQNGSASMFKCWERTSCYWCSSITPPSPPFTPDTDPNGDIATLLQPIHSKCDNTASPVTGCHTNPMGLMPCTSS
jgi:hypothetical protein